MFIHHFFSDPHFDHANVIKYANRPFADVAEMNQALIDNYNAHVKPDETVLWCGDCSYKLNRFAEILKGLNGHKILILGNHDESAGKMARLGFDLVLDRATFFIGGRTCIICHYPYAGSPGRGQAVDTRYLELRPPRVKGEVLIHGHTHSRLRRMDNMVHVGVDAWDYRPASFAEVEALVREV